MCTCKDVYISNNGSDNPECGHTRGTPCKTINFALGNDVSDDDVIMLMSASFSIDQPLPIQQQRLTFKPSSHGRATISSRTHLLHFADSKNVEVSFEFIRFSNVLLFENKDLGRKGAKIRISNCLLEGSSSFVVSSKTKETNNEQSIDISFTNTTINITNFIIKQTSRHLMMTLALKNSLVTAGGIQASTSIILDIRRTKFLVTSNEDIPKSYQHMISIKTSRRANVNLENVMVTIKNKAIGFLDCFNCTLNVKDLLLNHSEVATVLNLQLVSGTIEGFRMKETTVVSKAISVIKSNIRFTGTTSFDKTITPLIFFIEDQTYIVFESLNVQYCQIEFQMIFIKNKANVSINEFHVLDSTTGHELLGLNQDGELHINNFQLHRNTIHQAVFMNGDENNGKLFISKADIIKNSVKSSLFGVVHGVFEMNNARLLHNTGHANGWFPNVFVGQRGTKSILKNIIISKNKYYTCIKANNSSLTVEDVSILNNEGFSHGKAVIYESDPPNQQHEIIIRNLYARIMNFKEYEPNSPILSINMIDSSLIMENITIDIQSMNYPFVSAVDLNFATLNPKVLQRKNIRGKAYQLYCPPSYNPSLSPKLTSDFYSEKVSCIPCARGTYALSKGSIGLYNIDNIGFDVKTWNNGDRQIANRSNPLKIGCNTCPPGGNCTFGIKSQGNYYGQIKYQENGHAFVEFIPCPVSYCCSNQGKLCNTIKTCNVNRHGRLCGQCNEGFYESYFYTNCISNRLCTSGRQQRFWGIYIATALVLTFIIFAMKDITITIVTVGEVIKQKVTCWRNQKESLQHLKIMPDSEKGSENIDIKSLSVKSIPHEEPPRKFLFSALLQITIGFFQMVSLMNFKVNAKESESMSRIVNIFNLEIALKEAETICPFESLNIQWKNFIKYVIFIFTMLTILAIMGVIYTLVSFIKCSKPSEHKNIFIINLLEVPFRDKLILCCIKILIIGYKNISLFTIISLNCVEINGNSVMYLSGNVKCYQPWQWAVVCLLIFWVIPFPAALVYSYKMFDKGTIDKPIFMLCLFFPFLVLVFVNKDRKTKKRFLEERTGFHAILYDLFEGPFRSISTSDDEIVKTMYWWTAWRLYERLLIAVLVTFLIEPLFRMCVLAPVVVVLLMLHYHLKPYKDHLSLLSWLDISSYAFLLFYVVDNLFNSFIYIFDLPRQNPISKGFQVLNAFELILTPLTVIACFVVFMVVEKVIAPFRLKKQN